MKILIEYIAGYFLSYFICFIGGGGKDYVLKQNIQLVNHGMGKMKIQESGLEKCVFVAQRIGV